METNKVFCEDCKHCSSLISYYPTCNVTPMESTDYVHRRLLPKFCEDVNTDGTCTKFEAREEVEPVTKPSWWKRYWDDCVS